MLAAAAGRKAEVEGVLAARPPPRKYVGGAMPWREVGDDLGTNPKQNTLDMARSGARSGGAQ